MPIQYQGVVAEHRHTRESAGLFDLSHMGRLHLSGPGAEALIQRVTTNDASRLSAGAAQYTLICNEQGGVVEDLLVYRFADHWRLIVNASNREQVLEVLEAARREQQLDVSVRDDTFDLALLGVQGPLAEAALQPLVADELSSLTYYHAHEGTLRDIGGSERVLLSRTGYTGEDGFEVVVPSDQAEALWNRLLADDWVHPIGLGARDTLRLEAGMALYGHELTEEINPYEARLGRVVKLDKGPFLGREALTNLRATPPARLLVGLEFGAGAVPRAGYPVAVSGQTIGEIASGTFSPTLQHPIATAYVRAEHAEPGTQLDVMIRDKPVSARVVSLPFVPHRAKRA